MDGPPPTCKCNLPAQSKISRSMKNPNQPYFQCPLYRDTDNKGCGYFKWAREIRPTSPMDITGNKRKSPEPASKSEIILTEIRRNGAMLEKLLALYNQTPSEGEHNMKI